MTDIAQLVEMSRTGDPQAFLRAALEKDDLPEGRKQLLEMLLTVQVEPADSEREIPADARAVAPSDQVEVQRSLLESLADAIGACPACFGADTECAHCAGDGAPGAFPPDREAFAFFVRPALRRMQGQAARRTVRHDRNSSI